MLLSTAFASFIKKYGDIKEAIDIAAEAGFDALDFGFFNIFRKYFDGESPESTEEYFKEIRAYAESKGLVFNQAHAPFPSSVDDPVKTENIFWDIVRSMRNAAALGIKYIVVHPCQHLDYLKKGVPEELFEMNMKFYGRLLPFCEEYDINICVENMWRYRSNASMRKIDRSTCSEPEEFIKYIDTLASPRVFACLDIGHAALVSEDIPEFIRKLGHDRLRTLHVHDVDGTADSHTLPYYGICDWDEITQALKEIDYAGDFTYEAGNFINVLPRELALSGAKHMVNVGRYLIEKIEK